MGEKKNNIWLGTFFLYEKLWVLKGKANEGTNPPNCRRPAAASNPLRSGHSTHLVSNLFCVRGTMNPYHKPLTRTSWVNGTWCYRRQEPRKMVLGAPHGPIPTRNHSEQRGRSQNNPAVPYKQACRVQQGWWLPLKYLAFTKLLVSHLKCLDNSWESNSRISNFVQSHQDHDFLRAGLHLPPTLTTFPSLHPQPIYPKSPIYSPII